MNSPKSGNAAKKFAARLCELMLTHGYAAPGGSRSGVDVGKLAAAADTTYEMARRYAEGLSMPRAEKLAAIAQWLGVSSSFLAYGAEAPNAIINEGVLQQCISAIADAQERTGKHLSAEDQARIVAALYTEAINGRLPEPASVDLVVRVSK